MGSPALSIKAPPPTGGAVKTIPIFSLMLVLCTFSSWAQAPTHMPPQFPFTARVTASRLLYRLNAEPVTVIPRLRLSVVMNGIRYQLDRKTFIGKVKLFHFGTGKVKLLHLGEYPAKIVYHNFGNSGEFAETFLLKMPNGKIMKFSVTGISELHNHAAAP